MLILDEAVRALFDPTTSRRFDPSGRSWAPAEKSIGKSISLVEAATWLQRRSGHGLRQPIGVIGPRTASDAQLAAAEAIGAALATIGFSVVCGGREGVMEAVCRGIAANGGISIGLLPDPDIAA